MLILSKISAKSKERNEKRALISVSDKSGLIDFARFLENNYELISTGGTFKHLKDAGLSPIQIDEVTNFPEMLDGRVKRCTQKYTEVF